MAVPTIVLRGTTPRVTNTPVICGGVLLVAGVRDRDERDVCGGFGMATHRCVYDAAADAWMVDGHTDNSCPRPKASAFPCFAEFNSIRVDVGEFEADTVVLGAKTGEVTGVTGNELFFAVDPVVKQLTLSASGSFVRFNQTQLLLSLEMSGTVFLSSSTGMEVFTNVPRPTTSRH